MTATVTEANLKKSGIWAKGHREGLFSNIRKRLKEPIQALVP